MLEKLTLGEKLKDLRFAKGYTSTEQLASVLNIPKTTLNDYENDEKNQDDGYPTLSPSQSSMRCLWISF